MAHCLPCWRGSSPRNSLKMPKLEGRGKVLQPAVYQFASPANQYGKVVKKVGQVYDMSSQHLKVGI